MSLRLHLSLTATLLLSLVPSAGYAQTNSTWNSTTGNWTDATRWSTNPIFPNNGQPNAGDLYNAIINGGTVTLNQSITIQGLTLSAGTINGANNLTLNAASTWSSGVMDNGSGTTTFNGPLSLDSSGIKNIARPLNNNGTATWSGTGNVIGTSIWNNQSGALLDFQNDATWNSSGGVSTINNLAGATLRKSAGAGTSTIAWTFNNAGTVEVNTGTLSLNNGGASSGAGVFNVASAATLRVGSTGYTTAAGTSINGPGNIFFGAGTSNINGTLATTGLVTVDSSLLNLNNTATVGSLLINSATWQGTGNLTVNGATTITGFFSRMAGTGSTTFNGAVALNGSLETALDRTLNNNGTATWNSANLTGAGIWNNQSGAFFDAQNDLSWSGTGTINNLAGATFRKSAGTGTSTTIDWAFINAGTVEVNSGTLLLRGGNSSGAGVFNIVLGATLGLSNYTTAAGTSINGAGGVSSLGGISTVNGTFVATGPVIVDASTLNLNTPATISSLLITSGTLQGSGNLTVNGTTTMAGFNSRLAGTGTTTFNGAVTLNGTTDISLDRTLSNNATATWTGASLSGTGIWNNQSGALFDVQNDANWVNVNGTGAFNNLAGATFRKSAGAGISTINWAFNNAGSVQAQSGTIAFTGGFTQTAGATTLNGGTITSNSVMNFNGGSLTGTGTLGAAATFGNASIAPGASAGTITFGNTLTLNAGSVLNFELGTISDLINVTGSLTLDGTLNVTALTGFGEGTVTLVDFAGSLTDNGIVLGSLPEGFDYQLLVDSVNTRIDLQITAVAVPEPAAVLFGTTAIVVSSTYTWWQRKQKRRSNRSKKSRYKT